MNAVLVGVFVLGVVYGSATIVVNAAVALLVAELPAILERDYQIPLDAGLSLWLTSAVFFHAVGVLGIPGSGTNFYGSLWWWDHFTHALSASVVAGVGYATTRALDAHSEDVALPPRFTFVFILLFVIAFGVLWEVLEFAVGELAHLAGHRTLLTQYGLDDTMLDLVFDTVGAIVVAAWGGAYLSGVTDALTERLAARGMG